MDAFGPPFFLDAHMGVHDGSSEHFVFFLVQAGKLDSFSVKAAGLGMMFISPISAQAFLDGSAVNRLPPASAPFSLVLFWRLAWMRSRRNLPPPCEL